MHQFAFANFGRRAHHHALAHERLRVAEVHL